MGNILGCFAIAAAVMLLSSFHALPQKGHLKGLQHFCGYLVKMRYATIRFHTHKPGYRSLPSIDYDWFLIYGEVNKFLSDDAPKPLGKPVTLSHYVDATLFHNALTGK